MTRRRRNILVACIVLVVGVVLAVPFASRGGKTDVRLVFLRYTNRIVPTNISVPSGTITMVYEDKALFCISNAGTRPVKLGTRLHCSNIHLNEQAITPPLRGLPARLDPGKSLLVESDYPWFRQEWHAHISFTAGGLSDHFAQRVWDSTNAFIGIVGRRVFRQPKYRWATSQWVTKPRSDYRLLHRDITYPSNSRPRYHITAPPPPMDFRLPDNR